MKKDSLKTLQPEHRSGHLMFYYYVAKLNKKIVMEKK